MCGVYSLFLWSCVCLFYVTCAPQWYIWNQNFEISSDASPYQLWWRFSPRPADAPLQILHVDRPSASFTFYYLHHTNELCLKHQEKQGAKRTRYISQTFGKYEHQIKMTWAQDDSLSGIQKEDQAKQHPFNFGDLDQFGSETPCYGDNFELLAKEIGEIGSNGVIPSAEIKPDLVHCQTQAQNGCSICVNFFAVKDTGECRFCGIGCNKCRDREAEPQCSNCDHKYFAQTDPYCLTSGSLSLNEDPHFFTVNAQTPRFDFALSFWVQLSPINPQGTTTEGAIVKIISEDGTEQDLLLSIQNKPGILNILSLFKAQSPTGSFPLSQKKWICIVLEQQGSELRSFDAHNDRFFTSVSSPFGPSSLPQKFRFGNQFSQPLVYNLKDVNLFASQADRANHYQKVIGFKQPKLGSVPAYIQDCWPFIYLTGQGQSTSCSGQNTLEEDAAHLDSTIVDIRLKHQPSSDLKLCDPANSEYFENGECVACTVGCASCYANDKCTDCVEDPSYSGPNNGYCVKDTLTPQSGTVQRTDFRVRDQLLFLQKELGIAEYISTTCVYLDGTQFQTKQESFKLPRSQRDEKGLLFEVTCSITYKIKGQIFKKESVLQLQQTEAYEIDTSSSRAHINMVVFLNTYQAENARDECGGCLHGTCNTQEQVCICESGYVGPHCIFREDEAVILSQKIEQVVQSMQSQGVPLSLQILVLSQYFKYPELMTSRTNAEVMDRVTESLDVQQNLSEIEAVFNILSGLEQTIKTIETEPIALLQQLEELKKLSAAKLTDSLTESADYTHEDRASIIKAVYLKANQETIVSFGKEAQIVISPQAEDMKLIAILAKDSLSQPPYPANPDEEQITSNIELNMYSVDGQPIDFKDSQYELTLRMKKMPTNLDTVSIRYWDGNQMSNAGITDCKQKEESVSCTITHMSSFAGFLRRGKEIIQGANYDVFSSLKTMSAEDLSSNLGFYFLIFYWGLFTVIFFILKRHEITQLRKIGLEKIIRDQLCRDQEILTYTSAEEGLDSPIMSPTKSPSSGKLMKKKSTQGEEIVHPDQTRHLDSVVVQTARSSEFNLMKADQLQEIDPTTFLGKKDLQESPSQSEGKLQRKKSGRRMLSIKKLSRSQRLKIEYASRLRGRHCCLRFMGNVKREISSHNLPINFITTTSAFSPRIMRLCLFTLGILLEVAVCAFFFDLSGEEEEENLTDNFWIGLYSATFVAVPMVLAGWLLTYPNKYKKKIEANIHSRNFYQVYLNFTKKFKWVKILGYLIFAVLSAFLSLYIIAFCHKANDQISVDWVKSSIIGVSIDQILFEISPAMVVALFVLLASLGRSLHWIIYMAVCVELYRVYRNLTAG